MEQAFVAWNYWLVVALIAPMLWALVNIIDVYFVGEIYDDELDGTVVMGLFQILPLLALFFVEFSLPSNGMIILSLLAGAMYLTAMYFYFKALFTTNDATVVGIFWNISILLLPIIAFFVAGEKLSLAQYSGLFIAFLGASIISIDQKIKERNLLKVFLIMMASVLLLSISMAISGKVYGEIGYFNGFILFSVGAFIAGVVFMLIRLEVAKNNARKSLIQLNKKYFGWFIATEVLTLTGIVFSQRAIDLSPAVSFVAAIESAQAFFILVFSAIIFTTLSAIKREKGEVLRMIYKDQLVGYKIKILASIIIASGIYLLS